MANQYDDTQLQKLFTEMDVKHRKRAFKGAFRREANQVRRTAINNLRSSLHSNRDLEKGIRAIVFKKAAGFRVTIGTKKANRKTGKGEKGMHINRQGLKKPVLIWAEGGTEQRKTKTKTRVFGRERRGHNTGRMKQYGFMRKTQTDVRDKVTADLRNEIVESVTKTANKYGCK